MSEEEYYGESPKGLPGEGEDYTEPPSPHFIVDFEVPVKEKKLTFEEASKCLNTLGKDESGIRYAYLMITALDMKLTDISIILNFKHVLFLDLSGNFLNLEALQVLASMPFLIMLKANRNRLESAALETMPYVQVLLAIPKTYEISKKFYLMKVLAFNLNKITETYDIAQPMLEALELEFNQIFTAQFDNERLPNLKELDLKGNHLIDLSGIYPQQLERLFLSQNKITRLNDLALSKLTHLTTLHLRENKIRKLNGFSAFLTKLSYLNLRNNNITKLRQFRKLACLSKLETLIIIGNPVERKTKGGLSVGAEGASEDEDEEVFGEDGPPSNLDPTRIGVLVMLPNLKRINKALVTFEERDEALLIKDKKLEEIMGEISSDEETEPPTTTYTSEIGEETETEEDAEQQVNVFDPRGEEEEED